MRTKKGIPLFDKIGYGSGNLGFGVIFQIVVAYLVFYSTVILKISGSWIGIGISISIIWDGLTDPLMGYISDITNLKVFGRRHLYLLIGSLGMAVSNYFLWVVNPELSEIIKFLWVFITIIFLKTFMTVYATPYTALGAELSNDYNERTTIQAIKTIFFLSGLAFASAGIMALFFKATPEFAKGQLNPLAYRNVGITSSILMLAFGLFSFFVTKKYIPNLPKVNTDSVEEGKKGLVIKRLFASFTDALKNRYYKLVIMGYLFTNISTALAGALSLHVFTYTFALTSKDISIVMGTLFIASIISQPIWIIISKRIDKKPSIILALWIAILGCVILSIFVLMHDMFSGNYVYMIPFALLLGFGTGGLFSLPLSMIADTIDLEEYKTGQRSEGVYYGFMTFAYKFSQAIAVLILGFMLDIIGFDATLEVQTRITVITMGLILSVGSIVGFTVALLSYNKYRLNKTEVYELQARIAGLSEDIR